MADRRWDVTRPSSTRDDSNAVSVVLLISVCALVAGLHANFPPLAGIGILSLLDVVAYGTTRRLAADADGRQQAAQMRVVTLLALICYLVIDGLWRPGGGQGVEASAVGYVGAAVVPILAVMSVRRRRARRSEPGLDEPLPDWRLQRLAWLSGLTSAAYVGQSLSGIDGLGAVAIVVIVGATAFEVRSAWREATTVTASS